jgi:hypothetical protein
VHDKAEFSGDPSPARRIITAMAGRPPPNPPGSEQGLGFGPGDIAQLNREIVEITAPYDAAHLIAALTATRTFTSTAWRESDHGSPLADEVIVAALIARESRAPLRDVPPGDDMLEVLGRLLEIGMQIATITTYSALDGTVGDPPAAVDLAARYRARDAMVRGDAYERQELSLFAKLLSEPNAAEVLRATLGFDVDDAVAFEQGLTAIGERRFHANGLSAPGALHAATIVQHLSVTPRALARAAGRDEESAAAFLNAFSVGFGHREPGGAVLGGRPMLRDRPLVRIEPNRYLNTSPVNLLATLRPTLERAVKGTAAWEPYQVHRANAVEARVERNFRRALRPEATWRNVRYDISGIGGGFEADVVILVDELLLLVEVKSGDFSDAARRGKPRALADALRALVGKATAQGDRIRDAIVGGRPIRLQSRDTGAPLHLPLERIRRVEPIVVTLRSLAWLQGCGALLREAEIVPAGITAPWLVSLHELEVIAHLTDHPAQLTRYIERRRHLPPNVDSGTDEVNLWMLYLQSSLDGLPRHAPVVVPNVSETLDTYAMFGAAPRPSMQLAPSTKRALAALEQQGASGWLAACERLIAGEQRRRKPHVLNVGKLAAEVVEG